MCAPPDKYDHVICHVHASLENPTATSASGTPGCKHSFPNQITLDPSTRLHFQYHREMAGHADTKPRRYRSAQSVT